MNKHEAEKKIRNGLTMLGWGGEEIDEALAAARVAQQPQQWITKLRGEFVYLFDENGVELFNGFHDFESANKVRDAHNSINE